MPTVQKNAPKTINPPTAKPTPINPAPEVAAADTKAAGRLIIRWNDERDKALADLFVKGGIKDAALIAEKLSDHPAFAGLVDGLVTKSKVVLRMSALRKQIKEETGIDVGRFGREVYRPSGAALAEFLGIAPSA